MSKRKILAALIAAIAAAAIPAYAAEKGVALNMQSDNDTIAFEITNDAFDGKQVSFYLFRPGKSAEDLRADGGTSAREAIYQTYVFDFTGESVKLDVGMKAPEGENHTYKYLVIAQNGESLNGEFEYYTKAEKDALLAEINEARKNETVPQKLAERVYAYFNLNDFKLYLSTENKNKISSLIMSLLAEDANNENIGGIFEKACVIAAFSEKADGLFEESYIDFLGLEEKYLNAYNNDLSDDGKKLSIEESCGTDYKTADEIKAVLQNRIAVNLIINNKLSGYGHIEGVISGFESDFTAAGLKTEKYNSANKNSVGKKFMERKAADTNSLEKIVKLINDIMSEGASTGSTGGGGGSSSSSGKGNSSSGGSKGGGSAVVAPPTVTKPEQTKPQEVIFSDLNGYGWAKESIESLYKKSIISGKGESLFAPGDNITREEFTVILSKAFAVATGEKEPKFDDVASDRWSYEYIKNAYSAGLVSGDGKNFRPSDNITRQDIAAILLRTLMSKNLISDVKPETGVFKDEADIAPYAAESVQIMYALKILSGDDNGCFRPSDRATRAEAAVIIERALKLI